MTGKLRKRKQPVKKQENELQLANLAEKSKRRHFLQLDTNMEHGRRSLQQQSLLRQNRYVTVVFVVNLKQELMEVS